MMQWIRVVVILLLLGAGSANRTHAQQIGQKQAAWSQTFSKPLVEFPWPDRGPIHAPDSQDVQERSLVPQELSMTPRKRSWWRFPLIGAVAGGLTFTYITYRECQKEDCIFPVGLPLVGVALGAAGGLVVEGIIRVVE